MSGTAAARKAAAQPRRPHPRGERRPRREEGAVVVIVSSHNLQRIAAGAAAAAPRELRVEAEQLVRALLDHAEVDHHVALAHAGLAADLRKGAVAMRAGACAKGRAGSGAGARGFRR